MSKLPENVQSLIGRPCYQQLADSEVSRANSRAMCAAVENASPVYWDADFARDLAGAEIAPTTLLSTWARPELWTPVDQAQKQPLQLHFDLKALFDFPTAIVASFESVYHAPVAVGDRLQTSQVLRSVSEEKDTRLGRGRFWLIEMRYCRQDGALLGLDSFNCFGYRRPDP